jgi:hypothetical protein
MRVTSWAGPRLLQSAAFSLLRRQTTLPTGRHTAAIRWFEAKNKNRDQRRDQQHQLVGRAEVSRVCLTQQEHATENRGRKSGSSDGDHRPHRGALFKVVQG